VRFTVLADGKELWSEKQTDRAPVHHKVDLSDQAGKTIALTLRADALGNGAYDWSCWILPQVVSVDNQDSASAGFPGLTPAGMNAQGYREWEHDTTGIVLVELPGGEFAMGTPETEPQRGAGELLHTVTLSPFLIGKYEVTQAEYEAVMGSNPSFFKGIPQRPVERVSWGQLNNNPASFLHKSGLGLPSEAQWEYACRAGHPGPYSGTGKLDDMGWYSNNSDTGNGRETHRVGLKLPNHFGLHDMHGNVFEWVEDSSEPNFYSHPEASGLDPVHRGPPDCALADPPCASAQTCDAPFCASYRGGNFSINRSSNIENSNFCRSGHRAGNSPGMASQDVGFRVVLQPSALQ
jgi:formylglycine-generating enzyme required for sulfatase activity